VSSIFDSKKQSSLVTSFSFLLSTQNQRSLFFLQTITTGDNQGLFDSSIFPCSSMSFSILFHINLLGQQESARGLKDQTSVASVDAMVNSVCPPTVITLCCEIVLELSDEFLQLLGFSGAQVWPHTGYHLLQLLTVPSTLLWLGFQTVYRYCPCEWFTGPNVVPPASTCSRSLTFMIQTVIFCRAQTSVPPTHRHSSLEVFRLGSMRPLPASRGPSSHVITTLLHLAGITSSLARASQNDRSSAPGFHSDPAPWPGHMTWCPKSNNVS
jgi:hypothetical protein